VLSEERIDASERIDLVAVHEASHAIAMWRLGFGVEQCRIVERAGDLGATIPIRAVDDLSGSDEGTRRAAIERSGIALLAGNAGERRHRDDVDSAMSARDHAALHELMGAVEDDGSVRITWCSHVWQRAFAFVSEPRNWLLIVALARALERYGQLERDEIDVYLARVAAAIEHDGLTPNARLLDEARPVCSPWHRAWYGASLTSSVPEPRTELPESLTCIPVKADLTPVSIALPTLSSRVLGRLASVGIRTVFDLSEWNEWSLSAMKGITAETAREILAAAKAAGIATAPKGRQMPWEINPRRQQHGVGGDLKK